MRLSASFLALAAALLPSATLALPVQKRIAQTTIDSVQPWENACNAAGGKEQCNEIAVAAAATLLAAAGPCDQQNNADIMVNLAKQLNNDADMVKFAQIFAQQPRNTPTSLAVPYCQSAPANAELDGLFQCQFAGANEKTFVGNVAVGGAGTIPFGQTSPLSPPGSCPANPSGPVPDGQQLVSITQNPGVSGSSSSGSNSNSSSSATGSAAASATDAAPSATATASDDGDDDSCTTAEPVTVTSFITVTGAATAATATAAASANPVLAANGSKSASAATASGTASAGLVAQNALAAQKLNVLFKTLTASSACTVGDEACIGGAFAQCGPTASGGGAWVVTACGAGETCVALPLLLKSGTSIACDTQQDAVSRFSSVSGGIDGSS